MASCLFVDAAASLTEAAPALFEVIADLVNLLDRSAGFLGCCGGIFTATTMGKAAIVTTFAVAITEVEALATGAATTTTTSSRSISSVGEAAGVTTFAVAVTEVEALTTGSATTTTTTSLHVIIAVGEAALVTAFTVALITEGVAHAATFLTSLGATVTTSVTAIVPTMGKLAFVTTLALAAVTEGEADTLASAFGGLHITFVLARAFVTQLAATA